MHVGFVGAHTSTPSIPSSIEASPLTITLPEMTSPSSVRAGDGPTAAPVLVRGVRAQVVGVVSMNQTIVDVTDVPGAMLNHTVGWRLVKSRVKGTRPDPLEYFLGAGDLYNLTLG